MQKDSQILSSETGSRDESNYHLVESVFNITRSILESVDQDRLTEAEEMLVDRQMLISKLQALSAAGILRNQSGIRFKSLLKSIMEENAKLLKRMEEKKQRVVKELKNIQQKKMLENYSM
jgi:hypothetical protein